MFLQGICSFFSVQVGHSGSKFVFSCYKFNQDPTFKQDLHGTGHIWKMSGRPHLMKKMCGRPLLKKKKCGRPLLRRKSAGGHSSRCPVIHSIDMKAGSASFTAAPFRVGSARCTSYEKVEAWIHRRPVQIIPTNVRHSNRQALPESPPLSHDQRSGGGRQQRQQQPAEHMNGVDSGC